MTDNSRWLRMSLAHLTNPQKTGPLNVYRDYWWALDEAGNAMFFKSWQSPQCNVNRAICERIFKSYPVGEIRLIPWAYVKFNISDYT